MNKNSSCACKGIRYCLLCEGSHIKDSHINHIEVPKDYLHCDSCRGAWSSDDHFACHPNHSGEFINFPGIDIFPEFVAESEEKCLCDSIDVGEWTASQSGRHKQDFGPKVNFKKQKLRLGSFTGLPVYSRPVVEKFALKQCLTGFVPVELCNLEYVPDRGSAIDAHLDDSWLWGERLVTLNLLSDTVLTFTSDDLPMIAVLVPLPCRSLLVVSGPARHQWKHAIQRQHITARRIAMTFRELSAEFSVGGASEDIGTQLVAIASNCVS